MIDGTAKLFDGVKGSSIPPDAAFAPDGRWVAYQMGERDQVEGTTFIQPFPTTGAQYPVARAGRPVWSRDGKQRLLVPAAGRLIEIGVTTSPTVSFTKPVDRPRGFGESTPWSPRAFDIMRDGRVLGVGLPGERSVTGVASNQIRVVLNWFDELKRRVPVP